MAGKSSEEGEKIWGAGRQRGRNRDGGVGWRWWEGGFAGSFDWKSGDKAFGSWDLALLSRRVWRRVGARLKREGGGGSLTPRGRRSQTCLLFAWAHRRWSRQSRASSQIWHRSRKRKTLWSWLASLRSDGAKVPRNGNKTSTVRSPPQKKKNLATVHFWSRLCFFSAGVTLKHCQAESWIAGIWFPSCEWEDGTLFLRGRWKER